MNTHFVRIRGQRIDDVQLSDSRGPFMVSGRLPVGVLTNDVVRMVTPSPLGPIAVLTLINNDQCGYCVINVHKDALRYVTTIPVPSTSYDYSQTHALCVSFRFFSITVLTKSILCFSLLDTVIVLDFHTVLFHIVLFLCVLIYLFMHTYLFNNKDCLKSK